MGVIKQITDAIEGVDGVKLLDVDPGAATNRTVVTFVGAPEPVLEAAVRAGAKAKELIDMSKQTGEHPRFGAMDVCPLIPIAGITMEETVEWAHKLGARLGQAGISGYFYEHAAKRDDRRNLAVCRAGEYEALPKRLADPEWKTDFGPGAFDAGYGVTAVGARDFLVAYNVNLNSTSTRRANAIAFDIREKGRVKTDDGSPSGKPVLDSNGKKVWTPGSLKCVKGIGWFIEEYGVAQISMNLTNISITPVHVAFDECCTKAAERGIRVTGSEIVGLIPLKAVLDAGRFFLKRQQRSLGVSDTELIKIAVKSMGLDELSPFSPEEKIIEYAIEADAKKSTKRLVDMTITGFTHETASESPAPGGGSIAATMGALGAALGTMVANLSSHKRGWDDRWEEFSNWAEKGKGCHDELLRLIDADTDAFNKIMGAWGLPKSTDLEKQARTDAIQAATKGAIDVPFRVMEVCLASMDVAKAMGETGMSASASDAGVAALAARSGVMGAFLNVKINAGDIKDKSWVDDVLARGQKIQDQAISLETAILGTVAKRMNS